MNQQLQEEEEKQRQQSRSRKLEQMRKEKLRQELIRQKIRHYFPLGIGAALCLLIGVIAVTTVLGSHSREDENQENQGSEQVQQEQTSESVMQQQEDMRVNASDVDSTQSTKQQEEDTVTEAKPQSNAGQPQLVSAGEVEFQAGYEAAETSATRWPDEEQILSSYAILVNVSDNTIVAAKNAKTIINPASMTKILTVLVAAEHITDLEDTFTITLDITDYAYVNDCSSAGFLEGEVVTVKDLLYGTILPSGADAAVALATYVAGSQEAFVDMMNDKIKELGLADTANMTNCVGIYDKNHYCTVYDMAMIMKAAVENDLSREVLSAHTYTTTATAQHEEGITISNWFLRRIEDKETGGEVLCAKTGYVLQSGNCAASYEITEDKTPYICVTADAYSSWRCIYDHVAMYDLYAK